MSLLEPTESQLREVGSLKWTGIRTTNDQPVMGAWVAEMDFGTAPVVAERLKRGIDDGFLGYLPTWLEDATAEALTRFQERRFGWEIKPEWVRVANSVLGALEASITSLTRPGSAVIVPTPAYMPFLSIPKRLGREIIAVPSVHVPNFGGTEPTGDVGSWQLNLEGIRAGLEAGAGMVILCNPWNPTGRRLTTTELSELHDVVSQYDAVVFSDEIHAPLVFGDPSSFVSYASLGPSFAAHTITAVAASKAWNIAGLPAAQVILPDGPLRESWDRHCSYISRAAVPLGLLGAVTAYEEGDAWLTEVLSYLSGNLDLLDAALAGTAIDYTRPQATYLTWWGWEAYDLPGDPMSLLRDRARVGTNAGITLGSTYLQWARVNAAMPRTEWVRTLDAVNGLIATLPRR